METVEAPIETPAEFSYTGVEVVPEKWWTSFDDPVLNELVDQALDENFLLGGSWYEFQAALAVVRGEKSYLWPEISGTLRDQINEPESDFTGGEGLQAGLSATYEIDLWGRIDATIDAEEFRAEATYYDYKSAAMTVAAETSIIWYRLITARKELALVNDQIETNNTILRLIRARFAGGQVRAVDILRQEQLLERTRSEKVFYQTQIQLLENELAVLLGRPPQNEIELPGLYFPTLPPIPETGLPLELIRRRPDVQQAYNLVLAADREMAAAISSKYPRLSLNLDAQTISDSYSSLFQDWAYTLAGNLVAPLLYGGRLKAEVNRAEAIKNQQLYLYGQTVLIAFREVEDALIREEQQKIQLQLLQEQLDLAQKTVAQLKTEYLNGLSEYLDVLISLDEEQQLQRDIILAKQDLLEVRIALYRALAGAFGTAEPAL